MDEGRLTPDVAWVLPFRSQEFRDGPELTQTLTTLQLALDHETETGEYIWTTIAFRSVEAFCYTGDELCTSEQINAYDKLVVVEPSDSLIRFRDRSSDIKHFRIYFDERGCYDVAATGFEIVEGR